MTITLATLPQATEQEVFNQVKTHLLSQYNKSMGKIEYQQDKICFYRNEDGLKCAAGALISDEEYKPEMEGNGWLSLLDMGDVPNIHQDLVLALQTVHDEEYPQDWVDALESVAIDFNLTY